MDVKYEVWGLQKDNINVHDMKCLKSMVGVTTRTKNEEIGKRTGVKTEMAWENDKSVMR